MSGPIQAIYEDGKLRPLMPLDLNEGQEVQITILPAGDPLRTALGDLALDYTLGDLPGMDEDALQREIDAAYPDIPPVSQAIIEDRHEGR
jgi:hypothetical protein